MLPPRSGHEISNEHASGAERKVSAKLPPPSECEISREETPERKRFTSVELAMSPEPDNSGEYDAGDGQTVSIRLGLGSGHEISREQASGAELKISAELAPGSERTVSGEPGPLSVCENSREETSDSEISVKLSPRSEHEVLEEFVVCAEQETAIVKVEICAEGPVAQRDSSPGVPPPCCNPCADRGNLEEPAQIYCETCLKRFCAKHQIVSL